MSSPQRPLRFRLADVFAPKPLTGNGLAVFPEPFDPGPELALALTREVRQFESLFVTERLGDRRFRARIFTHEEELPFAGHPLLGAAATLAEESGAGDGPSTWTFELERRAVEVVVEPRGNAYWASMDQGRVSIGPPLAAELEPAILAALGLTAEDRVPGLPLQVVSTGLPYLIVPIARGLERVRPHGAVLQPLLAPHAAHFAFVLDVEAREGRTFDLAGTLEDPATGSAAGPVAAYLARHGRSKLGETVHLRQGRFVGRPSELEAVATKDAQGFVTIRVAGQVFTTAAGIFNPALLGIPTQPTARPVAAAPAPPPAAPARPAPAAAPAPPRIVPIEPAPAPAPPAVVHPPKPELVDVVPAPEPPRPIEPPRPPEPPRLVEAPRPAPAPRPVPAPAPPPRAAVTHIHHADDEARTRTWVQAIPQHPVDTTELSFAQLGLSPPILAAIERIGFKHPTPIQAQVIPPALAGHDILGLAQTGSGKTAAFSLPLAERLTHGRGTRGLILSPTREIALQTKAFLDLFGEDHHLETVCLIGGVAMGPQLRGIASVPDIVVATPGRLLDHLRRGTLDIGGVKELVIDEADHMLDLGFMPQIQDVLGYLPKERRTMLFSATMPDAIERLAQRLLGPSPVRIDILPPNRAAEGITHRLYLVDLEDKKACLLELLNEELGSTLVFIRRKIDAEWLSRILEREGHPVVRIHSDLSQTERVQALTGFREGEHRILVATDIAARGIDIPRIQHIINYDLPESVEDYIHRAGRTARGTLKGLVSSIATWQDKMMIREIESTLGAELPRCTVANVEPWEEHKARPRGRRHIPVRRRL